MTQNPDSSTEMEALLAQADWVRRLARGLLRDEGAALDLAQDVLHDAVQSPPGLTGRRLRAWLGTVARRKVARRLERERTGQSVEREAAIQEAQDVDEAARRVQLHVDLAKEIQGLGAEDRRLIVAHYLEGLSQVEIARREGVSHTAVRKRVSRARDRLRERLNASERGSAGWTLALGFLGGTTGLPAPPVPGSGAIPKASAVQSQGALALFSLPALAMAMKFAFALIVAGSAAFLLLRPDTQLVRPVPENRSHLAATDAEGVGPLTMEAVPEQAAGRRSVATLADPENDADADTLPPAAEAPLQFVRVVDRAKQPILEARAAWVAESGVRTRLSLDDEGYASVEDLGSGRLLAAARGFQGQWVSVEDADLLGKANALDLSLGPSPEVRGRFTIDGVAPGRPLRFFHTSFPEDLGLEAHESGERELERWLGLDDRPHLVTDENGHFSLPLSWTWERVDLRVPAAFIVRTVNGREPPGDRTDLVIPAGGPPVMIDLFELPSVTGRLVWGDDGSPVTGFVTYVREDPRGYTMDGMRWEHLSPGGEFSLPALTHPEDMDPAQLAVSAQLETAHRIALGISSGAPDFSYSLELGGAKLPLDVGEIVVPRHPEVKVSVRGQPLDQGPSVAVQAAIRSGGAVRRTDSDGRATLRPDPGGVIDVFAIGYRSRSVPVPPVGTPGELLVELERGVTLEVELPEFSPGPMRPLANLVWEESPFETRALDEQGRGTPFHLSIHQALQLDGFEGGGWSHLERGAPGNARFALPRVGPLVIGGLNEGVKVDVQLVDRIGEVLLRVPVELHGGANRASLAAAGPSVGHSLQVYATWDDGSPVEDGLVMLRGKSGDGKSFGLEGGSVTLAPLALGPWGITVSAAGAKSHAAQVDLSGEASKLDVILERQ